MEPALALPPQPQGAHCALHPQTPAAVTCARCGTFACFDCHTTADDGVQYCLPCLSRGGRGDLASTSDRFMANLIDSALVYLAPILAGMAISMATRSSPVFLGALAAGVIALAFQLRSQLKHGQSIGKRLYRLKVLTVTGEPPSLARLVLLRNVVGSFAIQLVPIVGRMIGLIGILLVFGRDRRTLHDRIAGTIVVRL